MAPKAKLGAALEGVDGKVRADQRRGEEAGGWEGVDIRPPRPADKHNGPPGRLDSSILPLPPDPTLPPEVPPAPARRCRPHIASVAHL